MMGGSLRPSFQPFRWLGLLCGIIYYPHERLHYEAIKPWCSDPMISYNVPREKWGHPYVPVPAQVSGSVPHETPAYKVRIAAIAPLLFFAPLLFAAQEFSPLVPLTPFWFIQSSLVAIWAAPSGMDLHTLFNPQVAMEAGYFGAGEAEVGIRWEAFAVLIGVCLLVSGMLYPFLFG